MVEFTDWAKEILQRADAGARRLNPDARDILRTFAYSMSLLAIRRKSPALIRQGLTAVAILGEVDDVRDLTFDLATLHYSAMKLGIDTRKLFDDVASITPSSTFKPRRERSRYVCLNRETSEAF